MRTKQFELEHALDSFHEKICAVFEDPNDNFSNLIAISGLNPSSDLRYADLRGVDFTDCDIRGFDFTGADLRYTYGLRIQVDDTTIFKGASLDDSVFRHRITVDDFLSKNPRWQRQYQRLKDSHYTEGSLWIADQLHTKNNSRHEAWYVAAKLFDTPKASSLRTNILFFARPLFRESSSYRDFLLHILTVYLDNQSVARAAIEALASLYKNDYVGFCTLLRLFQTGDAAIRRSTISGIMGSKHFRRHKSEFGTCIADEPLEDLRRYYVKRMSIRFTNLYGRPFSLATRDPDIYSDSRHLDFITPITKHMIERISRNWLILDELDRIQQEQRAGKQLQPIAPAESRVLARVKIVEQLLRRLVEEGVPFIFDAQAL